MSRGLTEATDLRPWHVELLRELALDTTDAWTATSDLGKIVWSIFPPRSSSGAARGALEYLEGYRLVEANRQERPVIWRITDAGRAALAMQEGTDG
jgi:hypothetical protein